MNLHVNFENFLQQEMSVCQSTKPYNVLLWHFSILLETTRIFGILFVEYSLCIAKYVFACQVFNSPLNLSMYHYVGVP